jgi:hypothetical protein
MSSPWRKKHARGTAPTFGLAIRSHRVRSSTACQRDFREREIGLTVLNAAEADAPGDGRRRRCDRSDKVGTSRVVSRSLDACKTPPGRARALAICRQSRNWLPMGPSRRRAARRVPDFLLETHLESPMLAADNGDGAWFARSSRRAAARVNAAETRGVHSCESPRARFS